MDHEDFSVLFSSEWNNIQVEGKKAYVLKEKLKLLKERLKRGNKEVFGTLDLKTENLVNDLNEFDKLAAEGNSLLDVTKRKEISSLFWKNLHFKERLLKQKSRVRWIREGDANTRFFHATIQHRRRSNQIVMIERGGIFLEEVEEVKDEVKRFFEDSYKEDDSERLILDGIEFQRITREDNFSILAPFTKEEIKEEIWDCDGNKSPDPDVFNLNFLKPCWGCCEGGHCRLFQ